MTGRRFLDFFAVTAAVALSLMETRVHAGNTGELGFGLADVFGPGSCGVCHGNPAVGVVGRYWPDGSGGSPAYVDDSPGGAGTHDNHVLAISQWLFQEDLTALVTDTGKGLSDTKQKAVCAWCHPNPGGPRPGTTESSHTNNQTTPGLVDVHADGRTALGVTYFRYYDGIVATPGSRDDTDAVYNVAPTKSCNLSNCHNEVGTPTPPSNWDTPPAWTTTGCDSIQCHQVSAASGAHNAHYAATQKNYDCDECHVVPVALQHGNGQVNLRFDNPGTLELVAGGGNGYYDENGDLVADNNFAASYDAARAPDGVCNNFYCHGDTLQGGKDTTPVWNDYTTASCFSGTCHGAYGSAFQSNGTARDAMAGGSHELHFKKYLAGGAPDPDFGPELGPHAPCYACHNAMNGGGVCGNCHSEDTPAGNGTASKPTLTHVDGKVDFRDGDYVNYFDNPAQTFAATPACDNCHSTANVGGSVGRDLAKTYWGTANKIPCLNCHNAADPAISKPFGPPFETAVTAPAKDGFFSTRGHGLPSGSRYPWPDGGPGRAGAESACADCHDTVSAHVSTALGDTDRLTTQGNALCSACHDGAGSGAAATQVSTHANTSSTMTTTYTRQRAQFELNCAECHDVHGTANIFMIAATDTNGPLVAPRLYNGSANTTSYLFNGTPAADGAVSFTTETPATSASAGVGYARAGAGDASKICQTCHTQTVHYQYNSDDGHITTDCIVCHKHDFDDDFAANSQDAFMPSGCNSCHGFPPVAPADVPLLGVPGVTNCTQLEASSSDYRCENYPAGGGPHFAHVSALKAQLAASVDPIEICGPCHGDGAGTTNHNTSNNGPGTWPIGARASLNIRVRASGNSWDGMASDPRSATYGGNAVNATGTSPPGNAVDSADSRCGGVDCHGNPNPGDADEVLSWNLSVADGGGPSDGLNKSRTCEGCHDETPSQWRVYNLAGGLVVTRSGLNAATNYYGPLSGYSRGGHGDAEIQNEDPFVDSGSGTTPIDCTACHTDAAAHFPEAAGNLHRLAVVTLEDTSHSSSGLCNSCHAGASYTGTGDNHHPSLRGTSANPSRDIVVTAASQEIRRLPSSWFEVPPGSGHYEQDGYSAQNVSGNTDFEVDWWGGSRIPPPADAGQSPPPQPSPFAVLPLLQFVGNQTGLSNAVMCVTCHNPHGTDLYVYDPGGIGGSIPDNNMLRLRDEDNTLCNACH